jgi:3-oxoacyl-[acyl-carrier-protein] synthase III
VRSARIASTGRAVAPVLVTNAAMDERFGPGVGDWLVKNTGIRQRYHLAPGQVTSDLAAEAGRQALERAHLSPDDLDLLIVATDTPDQLSPATAAVVQHKLQARRAGVFDLNTACAGFVTALDVACRNLIANPELRHALVIGAYGMSRYLDWTDKSTATLFADGAGAVVVSPSAEPGLLATTLWADGSLWDAMGIYEGGTARPAGGEVHPYVRFVKKFPKTYNLEHWPRMLRETSAKAGVPLDAVALFVFTQLNLRTIEEVMDQLGQPLSRAHWVMDKWGYTGSGCIPMTLDDAVEQGRLSAGDVVAFCASGGGVAMASSFFTWRP